MNVLGYPRGNRTGVQAFGLTITEDVQLYLASYGIPE